MWEWYSIKWAHAWISQIIWRKRCEWLWIRDWKYLDRNRVWKRKYWIGIPSPWRHSELPEELYITNGERHEQDKLWRENAIRWGWNLDGQWTVKNSFIHIVTHSTRVTETSANSTDHIFVNGYDKIMTGIQYSRLSNYLPVFIYLITRTKHRVRKGQFYGYMVTKIPKKCINVIQDQDWNNI